MNTKKKLKALENRIELLEQKVVELSQRPVLTAEAGGTIVVYPPGTTRVETSGNVREVKPS